MRADAPRRLVLPSIAYHLACRVGNLGGRPILSDLLKLPACHVLSPSCRRCEHSPRGDGGAIVLVPPRRRPRTIHGASPARRMRFCGSTAGLGCGRVEVGTAACLPLYESGGGTAGRVSQRSTLSLWYVKRTFYYTHLLTIT